MRVLVTGATGFLGGAASRALSADGHQVVATGRDQTRGEALRRGGLSFVAADLASADSLAALTRDVDVVVHCAALSSPWGALRDFQRANVDATAALVDACRARGVQRFVHISTPGIYMGAPNRENIKEDDPLPAPVNHYAATKLQAERVVHAAHQAGLASLILRPRAIFGPGDTAIFPRLIRAMEGPIFPVFGDGENRVDLTYVDNVVHAIKLALQAPESALGRAYNITNDEPVQLWNVIHHICHELNLRPPRGRVPYHWAKALGTMLELTHKLVRPRVEPRLTRYSVDAVASTMTLDITLAKQHLGYAPQIGMDEGLSRFLNWWKEQSCRT